jgi:O-antigen/teichoic acid export membrane protein
MNNNTHTTNNTKQAFWISFGSLFAFGFAIVSSMILSRHFLKEDYGTYKQVIYVYNTLLVVFTLGLPKAFSYFLPRIPIDQARNLISKITNLFFLLGGFFSLILFVFAGQISILLKNPDLELAIRIFSPVPLLMLPTMGLEGILATYRQTKFMAVYTVVTRIFMLLCVALPVVIFNGGYIQAIIGFVVASFISFLLALYLKFYPLKHAKKDRCSITYREIFSFSLPLLYASIWGIVISSSDQFFISRYFGAEVFADFSNGSLQLPFVGMIIGATTSVLSPIFSKKIFEQKDPKREILPIWTNVFEKSAKLIYPLVLFFFFFSDVLMVVLYGEIYKSSSIYFQIKLFVNLFALVSYAPLILAIGATKFYLKVHMYWAVILVSLEYLSVLTVKSPYVITLLSVICNICGILAMLAFISNYFKIKLIDLFPLRLILKLLIPSIIILSVIRLLFVYVFFIKGILLLVATFIVYAVLFMLWCYIAKIDYLYIFKPLISKLKYNN